MQTYAKESAIAPKRKEVVARTTSPSEWPYRVQSYQFKSLEAARKFSLDLAATPKSGHRHTVGMNHRKLEMNLHGDGVATSAPILLDVTTDSPDEAEAKYGDPSAPTEHIVRSPAPNQPEP